ncbi:MAG: helix-turn-helix transcriptional regulator [Thermoleophilia bacterium]|nr:helix-turn-helix transcriptional regulator [Thermoleophilia bacterium]MDH4339695.1 helix-turn-helix transcriptional regulator [Thermoleophilia bacterium]
MIETAATSPPAAGSRLGERVRALRVSAGLTQTELAGERFSKEYISQIERGKTRPTDSTIAWLADQLGVDAALLSSGVSTEARTKVEAMLARAEALSEANQYEEAIESYREARPSVDESGAAALELRALSGEAWALQESGDVRGAIDLLQRARGLAERAEFSDVDRADVLFRLAVCRYKLSSTSTAIALFGEALELAERSGLPCDLLRSDILQRRSRCYRRLRDYVAARDDVERALELAQDLGDRASIANAYFQASLVSQRQGHYVLSRSYAQRAKELYQQLNDERNVGRLLLMLGGLTLLLGDEEHAVEHLKASYLRALDTDSPADAAQALEGIARVHLNRGEYDQADELARKSLALLQGREDYLHEVCPSQLVLGRALLERGRLEEAEECFRAADAAAEQLASISHRTEAWVALGDLAARRGQDRESARLYRNAAEALQEIRF